MSNSNTQKKNITKIYDYKDKIRNVQYYIDLSLNRTLSMFKYENLPDSLPEVELEKILQCNGYGIITMEEGELIALWGGFAPPMDKYYRHSKVIVNNPWANINKTYQILPNSESKETDAVLIKNDPLCKGLLPIFKRYGTYITEADITLYLAMVNLRAISSISADTDDEYASAQNYLKQLFDGVQGVMMSEEWADGIKTNPYSNGTQGYITQIIELEQYLKGQFFNDVGLNANYNMKRERLNSSEVELNEDGLRPLIDSMLEERKKAIDAVNKKYGTNITVEFGSSWEQYNETTEEIETIDEVNEETNEEVKEEVNEVEEVEQEQETTEEVEETNDVNETEEVEDVKDETTDEVEETNEEVETTDEEQKDNIEINIEINTDKVDNVDIVEDVQDEQVNEEVDEKEDDTEDVEEKEEDEDNE